jgi:hypothetical protein
MGPFTFITDSFTRNWIVSYIQRILWREKSQNFFAAEVSVFVCFAQISKLAIGFVGFQVICPSSFYENAIEFSSPSQ